MESQTVNRKEDPIASFCLSSTTANYPCIHSMKERRLPRPRPNYHFKIMNQGLTAPKVINGRPLVFFRTYVGAAVAAVQLGFSTLESLEKVIEAARLVRSWPTWSVPVTTSGWISNTIWIEPTLCWLPKSTRQLI
jgi:hypothetical protein